MKVDKEPSVIFESRVTATFLAMVCRNLWINGVSRTAATAILTFVTTMTFTPASVSETGELQKMD